MGSLAYWLLGGWILSLLIAGAVGFYFYRRQMALERRTRQAERLAELGTLTGGLAHEIKNPLSTVQLNLQLLREDLPTEHSSYSRLSSRLNTVQQETSRLREILDDFLRYAGRIELDRREVNLNELLGELVDFFSPQAQVSRVQLRLKTANEPVNVQVDSKLIKQAVLNLMINATHAMPNGGELILECSKEADSAKIDITDTGTGIAPDAVAKIFQAYYSTKKGGTGLGLAMAKRIVDEHRGEMTVESELGKGSHFQIRLPVD
jgi:signal transduction histidine kinase